MATDHGIQTADLLIEIGTEELPPKALRKLERAFAAGIANGIEAAGLGCGEQRSFATPRRMAVLVQDLGLCQPTQVIEKRGPPVKVAYDDNGEPTRAAQAFAEKCGTTVDRLERQETPKGAWLFFRGESPGTPTVELLPGIVDQALAELPIPRRMRWGAGEAEFVRPVHWLLMLLGDAVVPAELLGRSAGDTSYGHRFHAPGAIRIAAPAAYETRLIEDGRVIPCFEARKQRIRMLAEEAGKQAGGTVIADDYLLDEVTALVEWPVAVLGQFDADFLRLPEEVLIATLQDHQRYFPVRGTDDALLPFFITMSNLESLQPEQVKLGNERVVRPRLSDAAFFWQQDCAEPLSERVEKLHQVVYQKGLGSLYDKSRRIARLCQPLADATGADCAAAERAAELSKADLLTEMVGEFPELQGRMGAYYAAHDGEPAAVSTAIQEQYLPRHAGDSLPGSSAGQCVALADRLDTLAGIFALGKRPSGNKDPFGLRRTALGMLRILIEKKIDLDLPDVLGQAIALQPCLIDQPADQPAGLADDLFGFLLDRLRAYYLDGLAPGLPGGEITPEMFESVRVRSPSSPLDFQQRMVAVHSFMKLSEADSLAAANKRIANILKSADPGLPADVDAALFDADEERRLHETVQKLMPGHRENLARRDYTRVLHDLSALKAPIDAFFDAVMVMADDQRLRNNRLAMLSGLRRMFLDIADLSCIPASRPAG